MDVTSEQIDYESIYRDYYSAEPFTHVVDFEPDLKAVINTNKCFISVKVIDGMLLITSVIDNLLKGASGQAVQNMNIMFGLNELTGLKIKAVAY
jgi:N-acetyl-gamma-glutamyl-phosphate reductase